MRIQFTIFILITLSGLLASAEDDQRPNIVLIIAQELIREELGCYGGEKASPKIDLLAKQGVRYETAWSMPNAELSMRTILTGRYPCHHEGAASFPELLKVSGYRVVFEQADADKSLKFVTGSKDEVPFLLLYRAKERASEVDRLVGKLVTAIDEKGLKDNTVVIVTSAGGRGKTKTDLAVRVPFIVRAPFLTEGNRVSRDLIDFSDIFPTVLGLAKIDLAGMRKPDGRTMAPSLRGSDDPFKKRNWICAESGDYRMVRDWQHFLDTEGNFHDLRQDPHQKKEVSPLDKQAPGRRKRLEMILGLF